MSSTRNNESHIEETTSNGVTTPQGIMEDECVLYYQPKTDVLTGKVVGVEALTRWNSPELGIVSPLEFIPIVERCRLIPQLTR